LWPQWQARTDLLSRLETADSAYTQQLPDELDATSGTPVPTAADLDEAAALFLTEQQAAELLNGLAAYAESSNVTLIDLQAQPSPNSEQKAVYDVRLFQVELTGDVMQLMDFVTRVRETAVSAVQVSNLHLAAGTDTGTLTMELHLYTSPYANGSALANLPLAPTPLPQPTASPVQATSADVLAAQIHDPWSVEDWPAAITLIEQVLALDPAYPEMTEKLYAAHVNYGYQLLVEGNNAAARQAFEQALAVNPGGSEAAAGLQSLTSPVSTSQPTVYVVQSGDTLFSIARRYGVSLDALRAANGLTGNNIATGQQLIIP